LKKRLDLTPSEGSARGGTNESGSWDEEVDERKRKRVDRERKGWRISETTERTRVPNVLRFPEGDA